MLKKFLELLAKKNCKIRIKQHLGYKKQLREKYMSIEKVTIIHLIAGLAKNISKMSHSPQPYTRSKNKTKIKLD